MIGEAKILENLCKTGKIQLLVLWKKWKNYKLNYNYFKKKSF